MIFIKTIYFQYTSLSTRYLGQRGNLMKILSILLFSLLLSSTSSASGPDCFPGQAEYTKNMEITDYGLFRGRFMCRTWYWNLDQFYFTGVAQGPLYYQELEATENLKSCEPIEALNKARWSEDKDYGLPVAIDIHFLNKVKLDYDCQPTEVTGHAGTF